METDDRCLDDGIQDPQRRPCCVLCIYYIHVLINNVKKLWSLDPQCPPCAVPADGSSSWDHPALSMGAVVRSQLTHTLTLSRRRRKARLTLAARLSAAAVHHASGRVRTSQELTGVSPVRCGTEERGQRRVILVSCGTEGSQRGQRGGLL